MTTKVKSKHSLGSKSRSSGNETTSVNEGDHKAIHVQVEKTNADTWNKMVSRAKSLSDGSLHKTDDKTLLAIREMVLNGASNRDIIKKHTCSSVTIGKVKDQINRERRREKRLKREGLLAI